MGRLKETLLAETGLLIGLSEGYKASVILDDLARESALGWDGGDWLVCVGRWPRPTGQVALVQGHRCPDSAAAVGL